MPVARELFSRRMNDAVTAATLASSSELGRQWHVGNFVQEAVPFDSAGAGVGAAQAMVIDRRKYSLDCSQAYNAGL